jgi:hypothetical protein
MSGSAAVCDLIWRATIMLAGVAAKVLAGDEESKAA